MTDISRVRLSGPLAEHAAGLAADLDGRGYASGTVLHSVRMMAAVSRWLQERGMAASDLDQAVAQAVLAERHAAGRWRAVRIGSLKTMLSYLREAGVVRAEAGPVSGSAVEVVLAGFAAYLSLERGLTAKSVERDQIAVRPFLTQVMGDDQNRLEQLTAQDVISYLVEVTRLRPGAAGRIAGALRSVLRFLYLKELISVPLADAVPSVSSRKLSGLPRFLTTVQVASILAACDTDTAVGRRDLAVLTVLSRLGLRAGEVAGLRLDDIDWKRGEIRIAGKGNRVERLPLPADVGATIVAYLRAGRPQAECREVFLCAKGARRAMTRGAVTNVVAGASRKAGLGTVFAHRLRHSAATAMLEAGGSLDEIGQVLRHQHALTTAIYAKVDISGLRSVARAWPGTDAAA
jgi:integrase/recombinase XerD